MRDSKPVSTPVNPDVNFIDCEKSDDVFNQQLYQAVVGSLLYLSTKTRPHIAYALSCVARFCAKPTKEHCTAVKRILRYLKGTSNLGLIYREDTPVVIIGYRRIGRGVSTLPGTPPFGQKGAGQIRKYILPGIRASCHACTRIVARRDAHLRINAIIYTCTLLTLQPRVHFTGFSNHMNTSCV